MMVSTAIAVLPVPRSPIISSRWPRPSGIMASTTRSPVARGRVTKARSTIAGAGCSTAANVSIARGAPPSSGAPSASTTRPSRASPTGTRATSPVPWTILPAAIPAVSPSSTQPIVSSARSTARPRTPPSKTRSSSSRVSGNPVTVATPSPTWATWPTCSSRGSSAKFPMRCRLSPSQVWSSSASVAIARDFRPHRSERALPGETENSTGEMQLRAGDELPVRAETNSDLIAELSTEARTPSLGGFGRQLRCSYHREVSAVDKLLSERLLFCLRQRGQVLFEACEPGLGAQLHRHLCEQSAGDVRSEIQSSPPRLGQRHAALGGERLARGIEKFCRLAFCLSMPRRCRFCRLRGRLLQCRRPLGCDAVAFGLEGSELVLRLSLGHVRLGILLVDLGATRIEQPQHRPVKEPMQQPDEYGEVDRLQRQGGPVEMHGHPA